MLVCYQVEVSEAQLYNFLFFSCTSSVREATALLDVASSRSASRFLSSRHVLTNIQGGHTRVDRHRNHPTTAGYVSILNTLPFALMSPPQTCVTAFFG